MGNYRNLVIMELHIEPQEGGLNGVRTYTTVTIRALSSNTSKIDKIKNIVIKGLDKDGNVIKEIYKTIIQKASDSTYLNLLSSFPIYATREGAYEGELGIFGTSNLTSFIIEGEGVYGEPILPESPYILYSRYNYGQDITAWYEALDLTGLIPEEEYVYKAFSGETLDPTITGEGLYYFCIPLGNIEANDTGELKTFYIQLIHEPLEEDSQEEYQETWCEIQQFA